MNEITAKDAKNRFGQLLDTAQRTPVRVTKNGRSERRMKRLAAITDGRYG